LVFFIKPLRRRPFASAETLVAYAPSALRRQPFMASNDGGPSRLQSARLVAAVAELVRPLDHAMPTSQNLRFAATVPKDAEFDHPAGAALMRRLSSELAAAGWSTDEMDNWRECGWSVLCRRGSSALEVVVSQIQDGQWMLQVSPQRSPGLIGSLFGGKPSASPGDVHELAVAVHRALSTLQYLGNPQWRWDGFPDEKHSTSEHERPNTVCSSATRFTAWLYWVVG